MMGEHYLSSAIFPYICCGHITKSFIIFLATTKQNSICRDFVQFHAQIFYITCSLTIKSAKRVNFIGWNMHNQVVLGEAIFVANMYAVAQRKRWKFENTFKSVKP